MTRAAHAGSIGPNAIVRTVDALRGQFGVAETEAVMRAAGLADYLRRPPQGMVAEAEAAALFGTLRQRFGEGPASAIARDAGRRTADYLLAHRIPRLAQTALRLLPPRPACRGLFAAIGRNTWTFAGSGHVRLAAGRPASIEIADCPLCRAAHTDGAACGFYAGTFERLFQVLVQADAHAEEIACHAMGDAACRWIVAY